MVNIYCMKCKKKTENKNEHKATSKNGRNMIKCECVICGTKKNMFIK